MLPALLLPTLILTWQAHSRVPAGYQGKVLPPRDSVVDVYVEFTDNGTIVPLDEHTVQWTVNGRFLAGGTRLTHISFPLDRFTTQTYSVTATVKDYNDQDVRKTILIGRVDPIVILSASPSQKDPAGTHINFTAEPFFFSSVNPNDYIFNWLVSGIESATQAGNLNVLVPPSTTPQTLLVSVTASNRNNTVESASARGQFIIN